jgi:DNA repair protein RecN (Recombination protein N)
MLQQLNIQNYTIIENLNIYFTPQLNIITGETGAGKSILMGALSLILGDRADTAALLDKNHKCIVEGLFKVSDKRVKMFLSSNNLDEEDDLILRREISPAGKSRAFINDTPATLSQMKGLAGLLVDLHRQFDVQDLNNRNFQLEVLDALCAHKTDLDNYRDIFDSYISIKKQLQDLRAEQEASEKESDYLQFLYSELEQANFSENEIENLENELKLISNAESVKAAVSTAIFTFSEGEEPLLYQLKSTIAKLNTMGSVAPSLSEINQRLQSVYIELKDIADELENFNSGIHFSEDKMNEVSQRMDMAYTLLKKHNVKTTEDLLQIKDSLSKKLKKGVNLTVEIEKLEKQGNELFEHLKQLSEKISANRKKQIPGFARKIDQLLKTVGMPNAAFKVDIQLRPEPGEDGGDVVEFLFNANKTSFQPLRKVASGGELSRLMLIIKSLVARSIDLPTLIFDEIDTGISGEAARQVGIIIKELSNDHQVILITHQPQIAAKAFSHFFVYKEVAGNKILTKVKKLNEEERIQTIATMLSGDKPSAAAFENAREMMK